MDQTTTELGPVLIAVYGATSGDDYLELFVDRHGKAALAPVVLATIEYLKGGTIRRGVSDNLEIPAVEVIAVTQAIERIIIIIKAHDLTLTEVSFNVHDRSLDQSATSESYVLSVGYVDTDMKTSPKIFQI